ncbi:MAG TPA: FimV/HubP family polar landmark protein, partial [Pseudolabrys sp.]
MNSALNEPLNADIDLIAAAPDELTALRATMAGREAFTRYGIDRPAFLASLTFKVGKGKDGRDALLVRSTEAIPEPFVTFLVEVNWARGRLMREYTVLLDPPVYTPGETASSAAPVTAPAVAAPPRRTAPALSAPTTGSRAASGISSGGAGAATLAPITGNTYQVSQGDTLTKIARSLQAGSSANLDQTMMALYRANPDAFGGNINILHRGAVLRVPGADQIAALNQSEAISEVHRQMNAWHGSAEAPQGGHLRLVTPSTGAGAASNGVPNAGAPETQALKDRIKDLEGQLAESHRLIDIRNGELSALQRKLGAAAAPPPAASAPTQAPTPPAQPAPAPAVSAPPPVATTPAPTAAPVPPPAETSPPTPATPPVAQKKPGATPAESGSWIDWVAAHWWVPAALILAFFILLALAAWRRRQSVAELNRMAATDVGNYRDPSGKVAGRKGEESFLVEESGEHPMPDLQAAPEHLGDTQSNIKTADDTISSESAVNLDQGDPLAEADFHMAYG